MSSIEKLMRETAEEEEQEEKDDNNNREGGRRSGHNSTLTAAELNVKDVLRDADEEIAREDYLTSNKKNQKKTYNVNEEDDETNYDADKYDDDEDNNNSEIVNHITNKKKPSIVKNKFDSDSSSDDDEKRGTPISDLDVQVQLACYNGNTDSLDKLLSKVKDPVSVLFKKDNHGWTPIHWASSKGKVKCIELLMDYAKNKSKAMINIPDGIVGWTPLHLACIGGHVECIKLLLEGGADPMILDKVKESPLNCLTRRISKKDKLYIEKLFHTDEDRTEAEQ